MEHPLTHHYQRDSILSLPPERIVLKLHDKFLQRITQAEDALQSGDRAAMGVAISKALEIVNALQEALDRGVETDIVPRLDELYQALRGWLMQANRERRSQPLEWCCRVMAVLRDGWEGVIRQTA